MYIDLIFENAVRDRDGYWKNSKTRPLEETEIPPHLLEPARGKFTAIEKVLAEKHGVEIPDGWNVSNVLAALAVGCALLTDNNEVRFNPKKPPSVSLITDDFFLKQGPINKVSYSVRINDRRFSGELYIPGHPYGESLTGLPGYTTRDDKKVQGRITSSFINRDQDEYTPLGQELIGFVASQVQGK